MNKRLSRYAHARCILQPLAYSHVRPHTEHILTTYLPTYLLTCLPTQTFSCYYSDCVDYLSEYVEECDLAIAQPVVTNINSAIRCETFTCSMECEPEWSFCSATVRGALQFATGPFVMVSNGTYANARQSTLELVAPCGVHMQVNGSSCVTSDDIVEVNTTIELMDSANELIGTNVDNSVEFGDMVAVVIALIFLALLGVSIIMGLLAFLRVRTFDKVRTKGTGSISAFESLDLGPITASAKAINQALAFVDVSYKIKDTVLLDNVTGVMYPGEMVAVMGPSGAGKSTALDIIAGRRKSGAVTGEIWAMGNRVKGQTLRQKVGFVDQEYIPMATLTVTECLMYSCMLRLPNDTSMAQRKERVEAVIRDVRITNIADSRIGNSVSRGISGGELRRLSIAAELVTGPSLLYLDEPTSSLDSYNAHVVIDCLKSLAVNRKTMIMLSIHQPSSKLFQMFDKCLLLTRGKMTYYGPTKEAATTHFASLGLTPCSKSANAADYLMDALVEAEVYTQVMTARNARKLSAGSSGNEHYDDGNSAVQIKPSGAEKRESDFKAIDENQRQDDIRQAALERRFSNNLAHTDSREVQEGSSRNASDTDIHTDLGEGSTSMVSKDLTVSDLVNGYQESQHAHNMSSEAARVIQAQENRNDTKRNRKSRNWFAPKTASAADVDPTNSEAGLTPVLLREDEKSTLKYQSAQSSEPPAQSTVSIGPEDSRNETELTTVVDTCSAGSDTADNTATEGSSEADDSKDETPSSRTNTHASFWTQTLTLSHRTLANLRRDPHLVVAHWSVGILTGLILGLLYFDSGINSLGESLDEEIIGQAQQQLGALLLLCAFLSFGGLTSLEVFETERVIFLTERANGFYDAGSFFLSKAMFDLTLLRIIPPMFTAVIFYFMMNMRSGFIHFVVFATVLTLCNLTAASICMLIGIAIKNRALALLVASLVILLSLALTNLFNNDGAMPPWAAWLHYLSFFHYAYEALVINELKDIQFQGVALGTADVVINAADLMDDLGFNESAYAMDICILFGIFLLTQAVTFLLLKYKLKLVK
ncbi:hypothetical protein SARC_01770 [Sphaeroforma arctica JP610]|uniref:ABC transporter domain-containing protein n=1 Tax=Sphaeroforma arctica JP610 TaxID=667725 RepID=A0A0L0GCY4_9EUKA|nr:hypothetical protein SARC_01770 [Sphaeroforma arctica JP610]KNC86078.1 hypothetical protein SARC_01770 [Sphaeroforma arctica JP610]|eukprot:XP_014159980.1 hypothetical protein SARC_01770 [Sphaeroforma arctica JP610]